MKKSKNKPKILSIKDDLESNNNVDEINDELINKKGLFYFKLFKIGNFNR